MFHIEVKRHTPTGKVRWNKITDGRKTLAFSEKAKAQAYAKVLGGNALPGDYKVVEV